MSKIYLEILDEPRQKIFAQLKTLTGCYLAGGTALALQIGHRLSVDFDIFLKKSFVRRTLINQCRRLFGQIQVIQENNDQITFTTPQHIKLDFVNYPYLPIFPLVKTNSLPLASVNEIAADKASTIGQRATWRDYVDIFFLLKDRHVNLSEIISSAKQKFSGEFNEVLFCEQLVYFKDLEVVPIEFIQQTYSETEIKNFLEVQVNQFLKQNLKI